LIFVSIRPRTASQTVRAILWCSVAGPADPSVGGRLSAPDPQETTWKWPGISDLTRVDRAGTLDFAMVCELGPPKPSDFHRIFHRCGKLACDPVRSRKAATLPQPKARRQRTTRVLTRLTPFSRVRYDPSFSRVRPPSQESNEANVPTQPPASPAHPWFSGSDAHQKRPDGPQAAAGKRAQAADGVLRADLTRHQRTLAPWLPGAPKKPPSCPKRSLRVPACALAPSSPQSNNADDA